MPGLCVDRDPPSDQRELVRHDTLSDTDLAAIRRCRGDHNRLGHALMLCYLRYPGRPLRAGERPPGPLLAFIADQIGVLPESVDEYLIAERNRRCHAAELQDRLQLRPFGTRPAAELTAWLPGCYRKPLRTNGLATWFGWLWKNAGNVGSFSRGRPHSNGSASRSVIKPDGKCNGA
jgi:Domain of unknown function (DUF4158)